MKDLPSPDLPVVHTVAQILDAAEKSHVQPAEAILPLVYEELRRLAVQRMAGERADHTLQPTALVNEAYLRLAGDVNMRWSNRAYFFAAAAEAMRRILIEHARARQGPKRGGDRCKIPLNVVDLATNDDPEQIVMLDEAISRLEERDPDAARVVKLRFFAGLSVDEVARVMGVSSRSVKRDWALARAFLFKELQNR
jgi:RNA polymerase sigma factor (TIGR02999 family)